MKKSGRALFYILATVMLCAFCIYAFHYHPEIQIAFLIPGVFLILFSAFLNDFSRKARVVRGK